jgi:hypothetical protein
MVETATALRYRRAQPANECPRSAVPQRRARRPERPTPPRRARGPDRDMTTDAVASARAAADAPEALSSTPASTPSPNPTPTPSSETRGPCPRRRRSSPLARGMRPARVPPEHQGQSGGPREGGRGVGARRQCGCPAERRGRRPIQIEFVHLDECSPLLIEPAFRLHPSRRPNRMVCNVVRVNYDRADGGFIRSDRGRGDPARERVLKTCGSSVVCVAAQSHN